MTRALQTFLAIALLPLIAACALVMAPSASWADDKEEPESPAVVETPGENPDGDEAQEPDAPAQKPQAEKAADEGLGESGDGNSGSSKPEGAKTPDVKPEATPAADPEPTVKPQAEHQVEPQAEPVVEASSTPAATSTPDTPPVSNGEAGSSNETPATNGEAASGQTDEADAATPQSSPSAVAIAPTKSAEAAAVPVKPAKKAAPKKAAAKKAAAKKAKTTLPGEPEADDAAKHPLADGVYLFNWVKNAKYIVQSAKKSRKSGANVSLSKKSSPTRQRWKVKFIAKYGFYTIVNEYGKKALAVVSGKNGANVLQVKRVEGEATQLWSVKKVGKSYVFVPKSNSKLALTGISSNGRYDLVLNKQNDEKTQRFRMLDEGIVPDGVYSLSLNGNAKMAATVPSYSMEEKKQLHWRSYKKALTQKIQVTYKGNGQYTLQSVHSGKYLGTSNGTVVQASDGKSTAQRWLISWNKKGLALKSVATGERLSVPNATVKNKRSLVTAKSVNNASQRFTLKKRRLVDTGVYTIRSFAGDRALAVQDGSVAEFGNIDAETASKGNAQKFLIKRVKGGYYRITNLKSDMVVGFASAKKGANVRQRPNHNNTAQLFKAQVAPSGGIQFVGVYGGKVLDIKGTSNKSGANVRMAKADDTKEQRWWLKRTKVNAKEAIVDRALRKAQAQGSATNWYLAVDVTNHRTMVLKRSGNTWKAAKNWLCSTGAPATPTVLGSYTVGIKGYSFGEGYTCYYYTQFWGDYLFHSVKYYQGTFNIMDGRLGQDISAGCVRLPIKKAKWIYDNIPSGTRVVTYK